MVIDFAAAAREAAARVTSTPSALLQQEVSRIKMILQPEASRDVTGPAATITRRIEGRLSKALPEIRRLEGQLKLKVVTNQAQIATQLGEIIDRLLHHIAMDWLELRLQMNQPAGTMERMLPQWLQKLIDLGQRRKGLPLAGGALRPFNLENTTGDRRDAHFEGEVVPHHALPEKQRKGLRPDGLDWVYNF